MGLLFRLYPKVLELENKTLYPEGTRTVYWSKAPILKKLNIKKCSSLTEKIRLEGLVSKKSRFNTQMFASVQICENKSKYRVKLNS